MILLQVDTPYCPNCLENMPSAEAKLKKNRYFLLTKRVSHLYSLEGPFYFGEFLLICLISTLDAAIALTVPVVATP